MQAIYRFDELDALVANLFPGKRFALEPYGYAFSFGVIASGATVTSTIKTQSNALFAWIESAAFSSNGTSMGSGLLCQINNTGSSENFFSASVPLDTFCNDGVTPNFADLPYPRLIQPNSELVATLTDTSGGTFAAVTSQLLLRGVNVFFY